MQTTLMIAFLTRATILYAVTTGTTSGVVRDASEERWKAYRMRTLGRVWACRGDGVAKIANREVPLIGVSASR